MNALTPFNSIANGKSLDPWLRAEAGRGDALHRRIAEKFSGGNAIPVERITITRAEYDAIAQQGKEGACIAANANARDAERYRWLRDQTETDGIAIVMKNKHIDDSQSYADNIDRFIDAAITKQGEEGA